MRCENCGQILPDGVQSCPTCGSAILPKKPVLGFVFSMIAFVMGIIGVFAESMVLFGVWIAALLLVLAMIGLGFGIPSIILLLKHENKYGLYRLTTIGIVFSSISMGLITNVLISYFIFLITGMISLLI